MVEDDFIASLQANPGDDALRLVYADWLEEQGDARADYLRWECQLHELSPADKRTPVLQGRLGELNPLLDPEWVALVDRTPGKWHIPFYGALSSRAAFHPGGDWVSHNPEAGWTRVCHPPAEVLSEPGQVYHFEFYGDENLRDDNIGQFCAAIRGWVQLCSLTLDVGQEVTNQGVLFLAGLTWLKSLRLGGTSDRLLAVLEKMPRLVNLELETFPLTDLGMAHLAGLTNMRSLYLGGCERVTDAGLRHLDALVNLEHLNLGACDITDQALAYVTRFPKLKSIEVPLCPKITDQGLTYLASMTGLTYIGLPRSGSFFARKFRSLAWVVSSEVGGLSPRNHISNQGVKRLREALPNCEIWQELYG